MNKLKIFIDTNILISGIIWNGKPLKVLYDAILRGHKLYISEYIESEFLEKLDVKWPDRKENAIKIYNKLPITLLKSTDQIYNTQIRDNNDIQVINDAIYHKVDILLTGDKDFAEVKITAEKPKIMTPSELAEMLEIEI